MAKVLLLDFDGTLTNGPIDGFIPYKLLKARHNLTDEQIKKIEDLDNEYAKKYYMPSVSMHINTREKEFELRKKNFSEIIKIVRIPDVQAVVETIVDYRMNKLKHKLFPETLSTLDKLKQKGYKLVILTNALPSREKEIQELNFEDLIDRVYISNLEGAYKPQIEFFQLPMKDFGVKLTDLTLLDNKLETLKEVKKFDIGTILMDKKGEFPDENEIPRITDFKQILDILHPESL